MKTNNEKKAGKSPAVKFLETLFPWRSYVELRFLKSSEIRRTWIPTHEVGKILSTANDYSRKGWN
ncbi:MAG: hypothetical protein DRP25_04945, partial [Thermotoga sp.]